MTLTEARPGKCSTWRDKGEPATGSEFKFFRTVLLVL
jgi:hypothetical protein